MKKSLFPLSLLLFFSLLFHLNTINCQFYDDFSDGDLSINPTWQGNPEHFVTNNDYQLQLDAPDGGSSVLYTEFNAPDSIEWGMYFKMDFNPSVSNNLRIYLLADKTDLIKASGYYIEIGENGSLDNIKFYRTVNGTRVLLGSGNPGIFAEAPSRAFLKITKNKDGDWRFYIKQDKDFFSLDFEVKDNQISFSGSYFIINCVYTTTRKDKFFFDDIYITKYQPDTKAPELIAIKMTDHKTLEIIFDEPVEEASIYNISNYRILSSNILPDQIYYDTLFPNKLTLKYMDGFLGGRIYTMTVSGVEDVSGNICQDATMEFYLLEKADKEDLIINEVLFNPFTGGSDFIEILNKSEKFINLKGLVISNSSLNKSVILNQDQILMKGEYVCITSDPADIVMSYYVPDSVVFLESNLPAFNDDMGNVSIAAFNGELDKITIDSFNYNKEMHSGFIDDEEGISLERKNPFAKTNDRFNWTSCSTQEGGATPGYINSVFSELKIEEEGLFLKKKVFSPDDDGYDDELELEYKLSEEGYLLNVAIYDSKGRFIYQLINNEILGREGLISWDGYIEGKKVPVGIYILYYKMIAEKGASKEGKKPFVVAQKLN